MRTMIKFFCAPALVFVCLWSVPAASYGRVTGVGDALPAPASARAPASIQTTSAWHQQFPTLTADPRILACPDEHICYAAGTGGSVFRSSDGGSTWDLQATGLAGGNAFYLIACGDAGHCVALATNTPSFADSTRMLVAATVDGGHSWRDTATLTMSSFYAESLACPALQTCYFLADRGNTLYASTDGGVTWTAHDVPLAAAGLYSYNMACPVPGTCYVAADEMDGPNGAILATSDGGVTWKRYLPAPVSGYQDLAGITCPSVQTCYVSRLYEQELLVTHDAWQTSHNLPVPGDLRPEAPSCPGELVCYLMLNSGAVALTTDGGAGWTTRATPPEFSVQSWPYSTPLVCPSVERCLLVAATGDILRSADGARSWSQTRPGTGSTLAGIACPSATRCYAAGQAGTLLETADGITWTRRPAPLGKIDVDWSAITCTTTSVCLLAGPIGIARTADGGATWSLAYALSAPVALGSSVNSVTCSGRSTCYAVGQRDGPHGLLAPGLVLRSTNGGATWKALPGLPAAATPGGYYCCQANSIACISAKVCVVATGAPGDEDNEPIGALFISHDRGKTWTKRARDRNAYFSVTCSPTGVCTAAGASTQGYPTVERIDASGTLLSRWTVTGYGQESLNGVSCLSASACYAVGDGGLLLRSDNGRRWVAAQLSAGNLMATACRGGTCYAAGEDSVILSTREP